MSGHRHDDPQQDPKEFWEARYGERDQIWSGKVNAVLQDVASSLRPGSALDLGCGEGGDAIWLAEHGWRALGVDISEAAVERARRAAKERGLGSDVIAFEAADLSELELPAHFDLVTASFLQSPVELARASILRRAAAHVRREGHLLITAHGAPPPWAAPEHKAALHNFSPDQEIADLGLRPGEWETVIAETRHRSAIGPDGNPAELDDSVVLLRRLRG